MRLKLYISSLLAFFLLGVIPFGLNAQNANTYSFTSSSGSTLDPMAGATTIVAASVDDAPSTIQNIGFSFNYEGVAYTQFSASPDGFLKLGSPAASSQFSNSIISTTNVPKLFPFWDDLATGVGGSVSFVVTGSAPNRVLKVQWFVTVPRNTIGAANSTMQAWLYETSNIIEFRYGTGVGPSTSASIGINGATSTATNFISVTTPANTASTSTANNSNTVWPGNGTMYTFAPPPPCTAPPTAGTTASSANPACSGVNFNLTVTSGATGTGLTYQWESSPDGTTWSPIGGAIAAGLTTSQTVTTWYRRKTTCSAVDAFSTGLQITMNAVANCYCTVAFPSAVEPITLVNFVTINNATSATVGGTPAQENFTAITANVLKTQTYPIIVKGNTDGNFTTFIDVYIDWNQDGDFVDPGENNFIGTIANSTGVDAIQASGNIAIPLTALDGVTRMRVIKKFGSSALSCNTTGFGQAEDYTLNVSTPPCILTCPANITVNVDPNQCGAIVTYPAPASTGVCGTITTSPASGSFFPTGTTTVTATSSVGGVICTFTITVNDNQLPTITCPANITTNNTTGQCGAVVTFAAPTTTDNCSGVAVTSVPASGSLFPVGTTTVTSTATDASGNTATCTFTVTVNDVQPPVITCPANITVSNTLNQCGAIVNFTPVASDNCPIGTTTAVTINQSSSATVTAGSVSCNAGGLHTDNSYWRAYDLAPLALAGPYTINTVRFGIETANASGPTQPVNVRIYTQTTGTFPGGTRTLVGSQTFNIPDQALTLFSASLTTPVTVPANAVVILELNTPDGQPGGNSFFIGSNAAAETGPSYISAADCGITAPTLLSAIGFPNMHILLSAVGTVPVPGSGTVSVPASGSFFPVGTTTVTSTATDGAGNTATCTFTVRVNDTQAPVITCPANITVTTAVGSCVAPVTYAVTATDNCPGVTTALTAGLASGASFPIGVTTVTHRATDAAGNITSCSFTVTVLDGQLPVISAQPANRTVCTGTNAAFSVTSSNAVSYQWQQYIAGVWTNIAGQTGSTLTLNAVNVSMNDNSYRVNVIGLCSTVSSGFASLYVNPLPTVILTASNPPVLLPTQSTSITANVNPAGGTFAWFKNGAALSPAVTTGTLTNLTVESAGTYRTVYTDLNGCVNTSADLVISAEPSDRLYIAPNPNFGQFWVRYYNQVNEQLTLTVFNSNGARVYQKAVTTTLAYSRIDVDLGIEAPGVYVVELRNSTGKLLGSKKIIVSHR
jgi:HYR domain/GEVED domain/Secretion system C-terminal sorting domain